MELATEGLLIFRGDRRQAHQVVHIQPVSQVGGNAPG
jgi:hypothetical protein